MAVEEIGRLRSIAIVGQGATGKTELAEAMLFTAGTLSRQGRPDDGTAAMDFEPEELHRKISISSAFHHLNWKKDEVILADTPGYQRVSARRFRDACAPSTAWCSWRRPAATSRSSRKKYGPR